jgi:hypothetical protein
MAKVMAWLQEGVKTTENTARLGCATSAVTKHIATLKTLLPTTPPPAARKRTGRKRKVNANMMMRMSLYVKDIYS